MTDSVDGVLLDVRNRGAEELGDLYPERPSVPAQHGQHRLANGPQVVGAERPLGEPRELHTEERVRVLDRLRHRSGDAFVEQRPARLPLEPAHGAEERGEGAFVLSSGVGLEHRRRRGEERFAAGNR